MYWCTEAKWDEDFSVRSADGSDLTADPITYRPDGIVYVHVRCVPSVCVCFQHGKRECYTIHVGDSPVSRTVKFLYTFGGNARV